MNKTYCPYAWNHFSVRVDGFVRLCCNNGSGNSLILDNDKKHIKINEVKSLVDYYNLDHFKKIRKNMIDGIKNPECNLCYSIEENGGISIRNYAVEKYPYENFKNNTCEDTGAISDVVVNYIDLAWSNKCNLQCRMCLPESSDQLIKEFEKFNGLVDPVVINNQKFWNYENIQVILETLSSENLCELLVTGGEPLINNDFYKFCMFLIEQDFAKNVHLSFHTNLTVTPKKWHAIFSKFKTVIYKVSIDATEDAYEYIRYPGKWKYVKENIEDLINFAIEPNSNIRVEFHTVFSMFNAHAIPSLLSYLCSLTKATYTNITAMPHFNFVQGPKVACPIYFPREEKIAIRNNIEKWISEYKNDESNDFLKGHDAAKISILRAVIRLMFEKQPGDDSIKKIIQQIKQIDNHRQNDTTKFMPWIKSFENKFN